MHILLLPRLYEQVHLSRPSAVSKFCNAVIENPSKLAPLVHCLQVGNHFEPCNYNRCPRFGKISASRLHKDLALQFRSLLELVFNLRELYLLATPKALNLCLANVKAPFKLRRLEISCVDSGPFYAFLRNQSLVTKLHVLPNSRQASDAVSDYLTRHSDVLPRVKIATGSLYFLNALSSTRLLSEVIIAEEAPSLSSQERERHLGNISRLFDQSGIHSVGWFRSGTLEGPDLWGDIIARIKKKGAQRNVRSMTIIETEKFSHTMRHAQLFDRLLKVIDRTSGFDNLECIEMVRAHCEPEPEERVRSWLEEFQNLEAWIGFVPSLKQVHIYGVDLR
ncbi:hypothetical protein FS749_004203 [Ceratobasidium sp. UAMH 11750]|nr:hypothetical protein FS749_004203 [Ceratobasidium sp. UAMH 11750]